MYSDFRYSMPVRPVLRFSLLLMSVLLGNGLAAEGLEPPGPGLVERPDPAGTPTEIHLSIYLFDIAGIDDVAKRFSVDMFVNVAWRDPRLALPAKQRAGQVRTIPLNEIWTPRGLIVNDRGLAAQLPRTAEIDDLGNVELRQRLSGELAAALKLKEFPFDNQRLPIDFVSYRYAPDELRFSAESGITGNETAFSAEGWRFRILGAEFGEYKVPDTGIVRPQLTYYIEADRNARYFLLTMFLPMSLIVFMAWTVFWLQPDIVPSRIAISTASIFSLIAFGFTIRLSLPKVSYMTRADVFVIGCTLLVFLALGVAVIGSRWASSDRMERALRLNAFARWAYVGLFALVAATTLLI